MTANLFLLAFSFAIFAGFAHAVMFGFKRIRTPVGMHLLSSFGTLTFIVYAWHIALQPSPSWALAAGAVLHTASLILFARAFWFASERLPIAFSNGEPAQLLKTGPYRLVRHPLYTSYSMFWIGCAVAGLSLLLAALAACLISVYYYLARSEERMLLAGPLSNQYRDYVRQVGFLIPRFP